jgi:hypothetical protein
MRTPLIVVLTLCLMSHALVAAAEPPSEARPAVRPITKAQAISALKKHLIDEDSAKFRNVLSASAGLICGEVNSKGKRGGYGGYDVFAVDRGKDGKPRVFVDTGEPVTVLTEYSTLQLTYIPGHKPPR